MQAAKAAQRSLVLMKQCTDICVECERGTAIRNGYLARKSWRYEWLNSPVYYCNFLTGPCAKCLKWLCEMWVVYTGKIIPNEGLLFVQLKALISSRVHLPLISQLWKLRSSARIFDIDKFMSKFAGIIGVLYEKHGIVRITRVMASSCNLYWAQCQVIFQKHEYSTWS